MNDFCLPNQDEKQICLKDFRGKWVVVYFYPKDNTPGCTLEAKDFTNIVTQFKKLNAVIVGISPDSPKKHCNFKEKHELGIILLSDEEKKVMKQVGVWKKKKLYGREYMGVVRTTFLISPEGKVVKQWNNVRVKGHADAVLEFLKEASQ